MKRAVLSALVLCSIGLQGYTAFRAYHLSFTHDESLSYTIVAGEPTWKSSVNNHPLNTRLMRWCSDWFGDQEWALRLPNVVSHTLYLIFGILLLRNLNEAWLLALGFALLNLSPFLLDFFSLARGYGIASGLSVAALFFFRLAWDRTASDRAVPFLLLSLTCAALADLANAAWVNFHLALLVGAIVLLFCHRETLTLRIGRYSLLGAAVLTCANAWFLYDLARRIWALREAAALYDGGQNGFLSDTVGSLIETYLYTERNGPAWKQTILLLVVGMLLVVGAVSTYRAVKDRRITFATLLVFVLVLTSVAPVAEHLLLGALYPINRAALYYVPLSALALVFAIDDISRRQSQFVRVLVQSCGVLVLGAVLLHFARTANLRHTYLWRYDADTKTAMLDVEKRFAPQRRNVRIGNFWALEPTINYYRVTRHDVWLLPATRDRLLSDDNDVIYCFPGDLDHRLARYS